MIFWPASWPPGHGLKGKGRFQIFICLSKTNRSYGSPLCFRFCDLNLDADAAGAPTWALDFQLAPEFAQAMKCDAWTASAIVKQSDFQVRHLRIESSSWTGAFDILACRFETAFPPQTWEPDPELANEATAVPPELFDSALERIAAIAIPR